jgi:hypothetical protein
MNVASLEVLQLVSIVIAPNGVYDLAIQNHHANTGELDIDSRDCEPNCLVPARPHGTRRRSADTHSRAPGCL